MQKCLLFALIVLFASFNAQAQDCPRIYTKGDTLYTDPAAQYQWYKDNQAISGLPSSGMYRVTRVAMR